MQPTCQIPDQPHIPAPDLSLSSWVVKENHPPYEMGMLCLNIDHDIESFPREAQQEAHQQWEY